MTPTMDIVFNINVSGMRGLGATLVSLVRHCPQTEGLRLWFLCVALQPAHHKQIRQLLADEGFRGSCEFIPVPVQQIFGHLPALQGDRTTYARLLIEEYVDTDRALYLDADLLVLTDVFQLRDFDFGDHLLAAVVGSTLAHQLDGNFLIRTMGLPPDIDYFNAGVILFNLTHWRAQHVGDRWRFLVQKHRNQLISHDQTLLNALCRGHFAQLPSVFNTPWYPGQALPQHPNPAIIHFIGSPKPWDVSGQWLHSGYRAWRSYDPLAWKRLYPLHSAQNLKRAWHIKKSIFKKLRGKIIAS